jgi:hypothetical protein
MSDGVKFDRESAERIARVVRRVEAMPADPGRYRDEPPTEGAPNVAVAEVVSYSTGIYTCKLYKDEREAYYFDTAEVSILNHNASYPVPAGVKLLVVRRGDQWQGRLRPINGERDYDLTWYDLATGEWVPRQLPDLSAQSLDPAYEYPFLTYGAIPEVSGSTHKNVYSDALLIHLLKRVSGYNASYKQVLTQEGGSFAWETVAEFECQST